MRRFFYTIFFTSLSCFTTLHITAQVSNSLPWTWMHGDIGSNQYGIYGTIGTPAPLNSPGSREGCGINWTDAAGNLWMFGGWGYASATFGSMNDLWKFDPFTNQWTWIKGDNTPNNYGIYGTKGVPAVSNKPGARHLAATWTDNNGDLWLFGGGGYAAASTGSLNDLWKYNIASGMWTWVSGDNTANNYGVYGTKGVSSASNKPGGKERPCRPDSRVDNAGNLWIFGGYGYSSVNTGDMNDLWRYNIASNEWTWMSGDNVAYVTGVYGTMGVPAAANKPGARVGGVSWIDSAGKFWLSGGGSQASNWNPKFSDLWKYDPVTDMWTWMKGDNSPNNYGVYGTLGVAASANNPGGRLMAECWIDAIGNLWVFGGYGYSRVGTGNATGTQGLNDLWKYDPVTNNWTWMKGSDFPGISSVYGTQGVPAPANMPGQRSGGNQWRDGKGNLWQLGGIEWTPSGVLKNDLWKLVIPQPVAKGNLVSCEVLPTVTIDATNNNTWVPVFDNIGHIAAEIHANGNNLGVVSTSLFTKTGPCRLDGSDRIYLNRNISITPQTQPVSGTVSIRLYILKAELDSLKTALNSQGQPSGVASINEVDVFKNDDACAIVGSDLALPLTATGGIYLSDHYLEASITSFSSFYFANKLLTSILPVKLHSFNGKRMGKSNVLNWKADCYGTVNFELERSSDGIHFETIGNITATPATCKELFTFTDHDPSGEKHYYRLRIIEAGSTTFSHIVLLQHEKRGGLVIRIQSTIVMGAAIQVLAMTEAGEPVELVVTDVTGRSLLRQQASLPAGNSQTTVNTAILSPGIYWIYGVGVSGRTNVVKFVKQ